MPHEPIVTECKKTLGHLAVHYRSAEHGPAVLKLLDILSFKRLPSPQGYPYFHYVVDEESVVSGDNILFVVEQPQALRDLNAAIRQALKVGQPEEHPAVAKVRAYQNADPEFNLHLGVVFSSLEAIEAAVLRVQDANLNDPDLRGHIKMTINRARPGDLNIDKRMDASPVFGAIDRYTYGFNGIQVFVETDLLVADALCDGFVFELDYVFPGHTDNILTNPTGESLETA